MKLMYTVGVSHTEPFKLIATYFSGFNYVATPFRPLSRSVVTPPNLDYWQNTNYRFSCLRVPNYTKVTK